MRGRWDHPKITETRRRIAEVCLAKGKIAGTVASPANLADVVDMGYRFIAMGADVIGLSEYCKELAAEYEKLRR